MPSMSYLNARRLVAASRLPLFALALSLATQPLLAQSGGGQADSAASVLARNVRILTTSPRNFDALIAAGNAAVAVGDLDAALGFFGRADEIRPDDWRQKAGMGAASVQRGDVSGAMGWFGAAERAGASAADMGADRGVALDLLGRQAEAQADYRAALPRATDPEEVRRRLALSLAIGGERAAAVQLIQPQLNRRDPAAQRTHAFILALTGDFEGARAAMELAMPGSSTAVGPVFAQLPRLVATQKAAAVHLGEFPAQPQYAAPVAAAPVAPPQRGAARRKEPERTKEPKREPRIAAVRPAPVQPVRTAVATPVEPSAGTAARGVVEVPSRARKLIAQTEPGAESNVPMARPNVRIVRAPAAVAAEPVAAEPGPPQPVVEAPVERVETPRAVETVELAPARDETVVSEPAGDEPAAGERLAELDAVIASAAPRPTPKIDRAAERRAAQAKAQKAAAEKARKAADAERKAKAEEERKAKAEAAKLGVAGTYWVQLAGGSNEASMAREYRKLQGKAKSLKGRSGHVTQGRDYFRLLVGPFKSSAEGTALVGKLKKEGVSGFVWTRSPAQLPIERID